MQPSRQAARSQWGALLVVVGASLVIGVLMGLVWRLVAPMASATVTAQGAELEGAASAMLIADDGWFAVLAALIGLLTGLLGWWLLRRHDVGLAVGLVLGGLLGALVAWRTGQWLGPQALAAQAAGAEPGQSLVIPLTVRAPAVLFVWPIAALVALFALVAGLGRGEVSPAERSVPSPRG
jgi:hypothetical protein